MKNNDKKLQNYKSLVIILAALFVGSLFVDVVQFASGSGFSQYALHKASVIEQAGKSWVAYTDPKVHVQLINDHSCAACDSGETLTWLRRVLPTIQVQEIDANSDLGQGLLKHFGIESLPAYIFSDSVTKTSFYEQAQTLFTKHDDWHVFDVSQLGITPGKYLVQPEFTDEQVVLGDKNAPVKIISYTDFTCEYCKVFQATIDDVQKQFPGNIAIIWKAIPNSTDPQSLHAALADSCAQKEGKGYQYGTLLFQRQKDWDQGTSSILFNAYAKELGLNTTNFSACLRTNEYSQTLQESMREALYYRIPGTPASFVGHYFVSGAADADSLKAMIQKELAQ